MPRIYSLRDNLNIPGKMTELELRYLARLAATVPAGGVIVEVGPLFGRSTYAIANAAPHAAVYSIDTWETAPWIEKYRGKTGNVLPFGVDAFRTYTRDCANITPIKGFSPDVVADWDKPIDLYFEDAIHGNPGLKDNLDFWLRHLKPGGVICGHDYTLRFPDVKREADRIARDWATKIEVVGSIWAIRHPRSDDPAGLDISTLIEPVAAPSLNLITSNRRLGVTQQGPLAWAGALLDPDPLMAVTLQWARRVAQLDVECKVADLDGAESPWTPSGHKCFLEVDGKRRPFHRFAARLIGERAPEFTLTYAASYRQIGNGGHLLSGPGLASANGDWAGARRPGAAMTALSIEVRARSDADLAAADSDDA